MFCDFSQTYRASHCQEYVWKIEAIGIRQKMEIEVGIQTATSNFAFCEIVKNV